MKFDNTLPPDPPDVALGGAGPTAANTPPLPPPKVLVVDDERSIRASLCAILRKDGCDATSAEDASQARVMMSQSTYDVVLCDIVMPGMSGVALLESIQDGAPHAQVILMTGDPTVDTAASAVRAGAADYLVKPIPINAVLRSVRNAVKIKRVEDARRILEQEKREHLARLEQQNEEITKAALFREEVEQITRHDLKGPLSIIIGVPQVMTELSDNLTAQQIHRLRMIENAGFKMLNMINLSLDLFRIEQSLYVLNPAPLDLFQLVSDVVVLHEVLQRTRKLSVEIRIDGHKPGEDAGVHVCGEKLLLHSLFSNLLKNAIEASPTGETVTVDVSVGREISIRIRNRGAVPEEVRNRFFSKWATSGKKGGTGLGAYAAKLFAEAHGGRIELHAETDSTTIVVTLPSADASGRPQAPQAEEEAPAAAYITPDRQHMQESPWNGC